MEGQVHLRIISLAHAKEHIVKWLCEGGCEDGAEDRPLGKTMFQDNIRRFTNDTKLLLRTSELEIKQCQKCASHPYLPFKHISEELVD